VDAASRAHILSPGDMSIQEVPPVVQTALDIMGIEWPKGMRSWKTKSGAYALEVHYSSDPKKDPERDGAAWHAQAVKKPGYEGDYESVGWQTEMEINYEAGGGDPVFPFLRASSPVFIEGFVPDQIRNKMRFYAGYDYGTQNPSAFVVLAVDREGRIYTVWELYEPCKNMAEHVAKIKACPYFDRIEKIVCDPSIWARTQQTAAGLKTIADLFADHGLYMQAGRRDQDAPVAIMLKSTHWADEDNPTFFLTQATPNTNKEFREARWQEHTSAAMELRANRPEKIRQKDNHTIDAVSVLLDDGVDLPIEVTVPDDYGSYDYHRRQMKLDNAKKERARSGFYIP